MYFTCHYCTVITAGERKNAIYMHNNNFPRSPVVKWRREMAVECTHHHRCSCCKKKKRIEAWTRHSRRGDITGVPTILRMPPGPLFPTFPDALFDSFPRQILWISHRRSEQRNRLPPWPFTIHNINDSTVSACPLCGISSSLTTCDLLMFMCPSVLTNRQYTQACEFAEEKTCSCVPFILLYMSSIGLVNPRSYLKNRLQGNLL